MKNSKKTIYPRANFNNKDNKDKEKKKASKSNKKNIGAGIYKKILEETKKRGKAANVFDIEEKIGGEAMEKVFNKKIKEAKNALKESPLPAFNEYALIRIKKNIWEALQRKFAFDFSFSSPPKEINADLTLPCFIAAKELKTNSVNLSKGVCDVIMKTFGGENGAVSRCVSEGGYANIVLRKDRLAKNVLKDIEKLGGLYGAACLGAGKIILLDYSSPNIAKPMSVGNLRSTIIGNSLKKIYEFSGFSVISVNHLGDWGTQFGKLLTAIELWGEKINPVRNSRAATNIAQKRDIISNGINFKKASFQKFLELYVRFHKEAEASPELLPRAREMFKRLERGDGDLIKKWLEICDISVKEFEKIYVRLGVDFDLYLGESFYRIAAQDVVNLCLENKMTKKDKEGATVIDFSDSNLPSLILQKSDGTSIYMARDIAAAAHRYNSLAAAFVKNKTELSEKIKIAYIVGSEQNLHFKQLFKILEILKIGNPVNFEHLGFGLMSLPDGKMSTREGRVVFLAGLLDEAEKRAETLIKEKNPEISEENAEEIKKAIGIGSVLYADLSQHRERNIVFNWDKMMNMKGDSASYLQYAFARTESILRKVSRADFKKPELPRELTGEENDLVLLLARFPETVFSANEDGRPDKIANYLNDLAQKFGKFYEAVPVIKADGDARGFRLLLVKSAGQVIKNGLSLLGIKTLERM